MAGTSDGARERWGDGSARVWSRISVGDIEDCWPWLGPLNRDGYGRPIWNGHREGAHRIAWLTRVGPIPEGMSVLHRCDNPPCCNPAHLFLGTQADNMQDCASKGRSSTSRNAGERNGSAKLSAHEAALIRSTPRNEVATLARLYGVTERHIRAIMSGDRW